MGTFFLAGDRRADRRLGGEHLPDASALDWALTIVGVLLFCGLTAYDMQRFQKMATGFTDEHPLGRWPSAAR